MVVNVLNYLNYAFLELDKHISENEEELNSLTQKLEIEQVKILIRK